MSRIKNPELLSITDQQLEDISLRISKSSLSTEDIRLLTALLTTYTWLMKQLSRSKITIHRLKKIFGYSSEKTNKLKNSNSDSPPESGVTEQTDGAVSLAATATEGTGAEIKPSDPGPESGVPLENK
jgi:hypothetical protein